VFGKTGTCTDADLVNGRTHLRSKSVAGLMTAANGKTLFFAIFVNDVPLPPGVAPGREGKQLGKICEIIYQNAP
jgi:serine-type D-Ala-D-Ala carboxypeptidase/endopeptidase (penicillin-binding protein 4)